MTFLPLSKNPMPFQYRQIALTKQTKKHCKSMAQSHKATRHTAQHKPVILRPTNLKLFTVVPTNVAVVHNNNEVSQEANEQSG